MVVVYSLMGLWSVYSFVGGDRYEYSMLWQSAIVWMKEALWEKAEMGLTTIHTIVGRGREGEEEFGVLYN